ncbi:MAG: hypothetical protein H0U52_16250 [Chloroflexi bacterium]|nr:hypothetical protein [Chloroflexota bacterium]
MIIVAGHTIRVVRRTMCREPGWWYEVAAPEGGTIAEGWCAGYGPRSKSDAMRDALAALQRRLAARGAA